MTRKNMRKFLVVIMDVIICILVEVQGNELSSTFFHHSSLPFSIPFAELDSDHGTIYNCLEENFAICEEKLKGGHDVLFTTCILTSCKELAWGREIKTTQYWRYQRCLKKYNFDFHVAKCLFNWHQNIKKH